LAWQLHVLALVRAAGDKPASQIASEAKLNPYVVRKSMERARSLSMDQLKTMIGELHQLDITLKSKSIDPDEALQNYILMIGVRK
jgi:DNA polymerase III delta subunit